MFFEIWDKNESRGKIGLATSRDALSWEYQQIVLNEPFHLSYPYVFEWGGDYYMIPETATAKSVRLYKASQFPLKWNYMCTLLHGPRFVDSSIFRWQQRWWLFTETNPQVRHSTLRLYKAEHFAGPWREHPKSPIVAADGHIARPAGRVVCWQGRPVRFAQDCYPIYGNAVHAFMVSTLTPDDYAEQPLAPGPILAQGSTQWNRGGMHHVDAHELEGGEWLASIDGWYPVGGSG
jgi:hypothetical protein